MHSPGERLRFVFRGKVCSGADSHVRGEPSFAVCGLCVHERRERERDGVGGGWEDCPSSLLVSDASLPGGQHVVEGISADAGPGEEANQRTAMK